MSSLRVRNLIKRFSVNETESKFKSEAENQPNNSTNNNNKHISNSNTNNSNSMDTSDSDSDVTDLERQIESLAQEKKLERTIGVTSNSYDAGKILDDFRAT
jgi:RNA polymerase-binding transcription factor DksA